MPACGTPVNAFRVGSKTADLDPLATQVEAGNAASGAAFGYPYAADADVFAERSRQLSDPETDELHRRDYVCSKPVGLSHELASPADTQVLDSFLREDLPGRFFTTERP